MRRPGPCAFRRRAYACPLVDDPGFLRGASLFDRGEFFAAHEAWEELWRAETDVVRRRRLQGLIQIAAGFHKLIAMRSPESAVRLLERGLAKLDGAGLDAFSARVGACASAIAEGTFAPASVPRLSVS